MKKFFFGIVMMLAAFCIVAPASECGATDVWVAHWNDENVDIYVMDDTLQYGTGSTGRWFNVVTKKVRDGRLLRTIDWKFSKFKSDMWRYETSTMDGRHTTVVMPMFASGEIRQIASVEKRQFGSAEIRQFESIEKSQS